MFICLCQAVTDRQIQSAVADGATTLRDLRLQLGIARDCGACAADALKCLRAARDQQTIGGCPGSCAGRTQGPSPTIPLVADHVAV